MTHNKIKTICAWCKKLIQDGDTPEMFGIKRISHGMCPECFGNWDEVQERMWKQSEIDERESNEKYIEPSERE